MKYRWIDDINKFRDISAEWDKALIDSDYRNPFLLSDFIITWWKYYYEGLSLAIFVLYDSDKITGGIPLYIKNGGVRTGFARVFGYIGDAAANHTEPLLRSESTHFLPIFTEALSERRDWDVLHLRNVRGESKLLSEYREGMFERRFSFRAVQDHMDWSVDLSAGKDNYYAARAKKLKQDTRAKRRFAAKNYGEVRLKAVKGPAEVERLFGLYTDFSICALGSRNIKSNFENDKYNSFFKELLVLMEKKERLYAHKLVAGEKVLAISFGYRFGRGYNWILNTFNYEYKYTRPGYILVMELIDEIERLGETEYNWYGHETLYKRQWCNKKTPLWQFFIINRTLGGHCYSALSSARRAIKSNKYARDVILKIKNANLGEKQIVR